MTELINKSLSGITQHPELFYSLICLIMAGIFNAVMDRLSNEGAFVTSIFNRFKRENWLKSESWTRKYKRYATGKLVVDHYDKNNRPVYAPAFSFLGLTSIKSLVFLTDPWHFAQWLQNSFVCFGVMFAFGSSPNHFIFWIGWVVLRVVSMSFFALFYGSIFRARS